MIVTSRLRDVICDFGCLAAVTNQRRQRDGPGQRMRVASRPGRDRPLAAGARTEQIVTKRPLVAYSSLTREALNDRRLDYRAYDRNRSRRDD
jgi:hypothetical protein